MGLFTGGGRCLAHGQTDAEVRSAGGGLEDFDAAAMSIDEFGDHREADAGSLDVAPLRCLALVERLEYPISLLRRDSGTRCP